MQPSDSDDSPSLSDSGSNSGSANGVHFNSVSILLCPHLLVYLVCVYACMWYVCYMIRVHVCV